MSMVKCFFINNGASMIIGEVTEQMDDTFTVKNPLVIIQNRDGIGFIPLLNIMEDKSMALKKSEILGENLFEPVWELKNEYNKLFGTGIIQSGTSIITT